VPRKRPEPLARVVQPRHHRSQRDVQHLGDLSVREAFHVAQHDNSAEIRRQRVEHARDPPKEETVVLVPARQEIDPLVELRELPFELDDGIRLLRAGL